MKFRIDLASLDKQARRKEAIHRKEMPGIKGGMVLSPPPDLPPWAYVCWDWCTISHVRDTESKYFAPSGPV